MNRRHALLILGSSLTALTLRAQPTGGKRGIDVARDIFALAVAHSFKRDPASFRVLPVSEPSEAYAGLRLGDLHAWSAEVIGGRVFVNGFASAGENAGSAFEGCVDTFGKPLGLAALLSAMRLNEPLQRLSLEQMMPRIAFCLNRPDLGEILFDPKVMESSGFATPDAVTEPRLHPQKSGHMLTYFTMVPGLTGTWDVWQVSLTVMADYVSLITRQPLT